MKQEKHIAFIFTEVVMVRVLVEKVSKLIKPDNLPIKTYVYYRNMDRK